MAQSPHSNSPTPRLGAHAEPIAVVGMACRFPHASNVSAFWRLLENGENAVSEGDPGSGVGRIGDLFKDVSVQNEACRFAAFIDDIDMFDAPFFRISPVEAQHLDPQQRLMLETSWQALEDAGINPGKLVGSRTGVYAGISNNEYRGMIMDASDTSDPASSLYTVSGTSYNTAIGRVSFALGLQGPAIALDTACSSSLVAIHLAVSGLQHGESDLALAGGVHTILSGRLLELRGNAGMLAPDGRCKTFDASANGYVRGEGCGILVLKRLSDAEADGDRIWGVIRGSAMNQDGATQGLTVPSRDAQVKVIHDALRKSGIPATQVDYVEAHGTGTPVGDPIELEAMGAAYGKDRPPDRPLLIGSVKTNFGHLESAAGVAGVMKTLLAMNKGIIPKHLNFRSPTPVVDWTKLSLKVTSAPTEWPNANDHSPLAGVSGFGWSGTNAHLIVEGYPSSTRIPNEAWPAGPSKSIALTSPEDTSSPTEKAPTPRPNRLFPLSAKTDNAMRELAKRYISWLDNLPTGSHDLADAAWTASVGRSHFRRRASIPFSDAASLRSGLLAVANDDLGPAPQETKPARKVAFAYTGQGGQWPGMGKFLYDSEPVFRAILDRCEQAMLQERGASLLAVMFGNERAVSDVYDTAWAQPALYALECAFTALWRSIGVEPDVVIGHSLGEFAAAQAAGVFSLEDGLRFVARRGELLSSVPEPGAMAAVFAPRQEVAAAVEECNKASGSTALCIAVDNGVHQVISGTDAAVKAVSETFEAREVMVRPLRNQAFHSHLLEPAIDDLEEAYKDIVVSPPTVPLISNSTGSLVSSTDTLAGKYWRRHSREPVQFRKGVDTMTAMGVDLVIEIGPHAILGPLVSLIWPDSAGSADAPPTLQSMIRPSRDIPPSEYRDAFMDAVAGAYNVGLTLNFEGLFAGEERRRVELPGYPFARQRHWIEPPRRRHSAAGHPLLGTRHESPRGDVMFQTEMFPSDPHWLNHHQVYGRVIMPGALYGSMAAAAALSEGAQTVEVEDLQLRAAMIFAEEDAEETGWENGRRIQAVLAAPENGGSRRIEIFSKADSEEAWTLHAEGRISIGGKQSAPPDRIDVNLLKEGMTLMDVPTFYRARAQSNIDLGPSFQTLQAIWAGNNQAFAEIALPETVDGAGINSHPILLDGCFQAFSAARSSAAGDDNVTYLPFGWEKLSLRQQIPERLICHARMNRTVSGSETEDAPTNAPEVLSADLLFYTLDGQEVGGLTGYAVKRTTRAALLSAAEGIQDLLYEVIWRDRVLEEGMPSADFLTSPSEIFAASAPFTEYLADESIQAHERISLLHDLERMSWYFALTALEKLGWKREVGDLIEPEALRQEMNVHPQHERVLRRMFELLDRAGVVQKKGADFVVKVDREDPLPDSMPRDIDQFADWMISKYWHGTTEVGLFRRCGAALADVLVGKADPLTILFSSGQPTPADLYLNAPVARAGNRMLGDAMAKLLQNVPEGRRLRIIEVGAGTGASTSAVLPELPPGRFLYTYTDISAGFFSEAESRFGGDDGSIEYRVLDIEKDPISQGFDLHGYDLVIAANVLHATRFLNETLDNCLKLLAPSGVLIAAENLHGQGWQDLTFGQLDGWWRFADRYRPRHALASPAVWQQALQDSGFVDTAVVGTSKNGSGAEPDRGVIMAQGPARIEESAGLWLLAGDNSGVSEAIAGSLAVRNQTVILATDKSTSAANGVSVNHSVDAQSRDSWQSLLEQLPPDVPFSGVIHCTALDGNSADSDTDEFQADAKNVVSSALSLVQGLADADATPTNGVWFLTSGGQVLEKERAGQLPGAMLWGFGKVVAREAPHLQPKMIDLDPDSPLPVSDLANEFLYPDSHTHIAYRTGLRQVGQLVRFGTDTERLTQPESGGWFVEPDPGGSLDGIQLLDAPERALEPWEVRVAVEASGLNFWDVFRSLALIDEGILGGEMCGHVFEVGSEVASVSVGDRVVALAFGTFSSEAIMHEAMVAPAPPGVPTMQLATMPTVFVSAALSYDLARLKAGDRVLIHAGAGGVGLAAIQLAHAAGAEVYATASAPKQPYLRSMGVNHVYDSRQTIFGKQILEDTAGEGVNVVLNSLTSEGFIESSLSCLAQGGRFIELARVGTYTHEEMAAARPDVDYHILELDTLKEHDPSTPGKALRAVMKQVESGVLTPLVHSRWSMGEAGPAMKFMRSARHIGKIVLANSALETGRLRDDRTYLVTGGLGGIGCALAAWLADKGAGAIVLNGRRDPDPSAMQAIEALRSQGVNVEVELADVTDADAVNAMLMRIHRSMPPLAGVIHSVGVLSDAALVNQTWDSMKTVIWPKALGAWHLHRATLDENLDMFIVFSSIAGVMGNAGQANHAAANAFLDQLAAHRRSMGLPGQSIAWGAWSELGEAEEQRERIERQLEAAGTGWITPQQGLKALEYLIQQDASFGMVGEVDWNTIAQNRDESSLFIEDLLNATTSTETEPDDESEDLLTRLRASQATDSEELVASFLQGELQAVMRLPTPPSRSVGFFDLGMDSLMAVELRNRLNRAFDGEYVVSNTAVFDYPDVSSLARHLAEELGQLNPAPPAAAVASPKPVVTASNAVETQDIAVIGMSCRFPQANSLAEYWRLLESGVDAVTDGRRDVEDLPNIRGAFVDGIQWFDSRFFRIAPIEARMMDPRQRMMLETSWEALEDAGISPESLRGSSTGVYAGVGGSEYRDLIESSGKADSYLGTTASVTAGRVAFALGLEGPAMAIDMACASALAAIHQAVTALQRREIDLALAGGVHVVLSHAVTEFMTEVGMLSKSGQCSPFDAAADGYVRGEGCGMFALKRLSDAESDGDRIWGVIKGSAVNQNGASAGLIVPNGPAQERVMEAALANAGLSGADVDYLEAHATGSQLGDAIEANAVGAVYGTNRDPDNPLLIGTVKSNIGHLEAAAGAAGLMKALMAMKQGVIPKHLHFTNPNPQIEWERLPLSVMAEVTPWPAQQHRPPRAAVSAFGISGANAHLVVEGYGDAMDPTIEPDRLRPFQGKAQPVSISATQPTDAPPSTLEQLRERKTRFLPLSAKSRDGLRAMADRYLITLDSLTSNGADLDDLTWTAGVGRSHFDHRATVVFRDVSSLRQGLERVSKADDLASDETEKVANRIAFLYPDDTAQLVNVAKSLYETEPAVRATLDRLEQIALEERGASLLNVMLERDEAAGDLKDPAWAQPALFALQCALTALWAGVGISPNVVLGKGTGELAAAQAAGVFSLEDSMRFTLARGALMAALPGLDPNQSMRGLDTAYANVNVMPPSLTLVSGLAGRPVSETGLMDATYWSRQMRAASPPDSLASSLAQLGVNVIVEVGPRANLGEQIVQEWPPPTDPKSSQQPILVQTCTDSQFEAGSDDFGAFAEAAANAYQAGLNLRFEGLFAGETRRRVSLPTYPFQRRRHWI